LNVNVIIAAVGLLSENQTNVLNATGIILKKPMKGIDIDVTTMRQTKTKKPVVDFQRRPPMYKVPLSKPSYLSYTDEVCEAVNKVIRSGHIAMGERVEEFEQRIADFCGTKYAVAVSSGTAGLFLCLKAIGIGPGDEVITTPFSFIASSNVIEHCGAKPVFVDIDRETYNLDVQKVMERLNRKPTFWHKLYACLFDDFSKYPRKPKAILPVDVFGSPIDTNQFKDIPVILDSCESFGSKMDRPFDAAVYAFYPNKQLTTGEGGVIVTNNPQIAEYCQAMRNQGRKKGDKWLESSMIGWNFRMTDMQAAIGLVQLNHWPEIYNKRLHVYDYYLSQLPPVIADYPKFEENDKLEAFSPFVFTVELDNRDKVMQYLLDNGIECKRYFPCIHLQLPYLEQGYNRGMYPVAELVSSRTLALPFFCDMTESEVDLVCETLKEALHETGKM
jgi:perosamine synthetase